jgi:spore coat polysaccharide biosynthesis protein SpsF
MGSTRLPGKVMMKINGKPLLYYVLNQVKSSKHVSRIFVATSTLSQDDEIEYYANSQNVEVFRGSETDVLDRFYQCAKKFSLDPIIRISADSPFIDPKIIDQCIENFQKTNVDYLSNVVNNEKNHWKEHHNGFPNGTAVEIFSFSSLEKSWRESIKPSDREHVTEYIINHSEKFKINSISNFIDQSKFRIVVDTYDDFKQAENIIMNLDYTMPFDINTIISFLKK